MNNINVGDSYYTIESDHKTLLELKVSNVEHSGNENLIFLTSDNNCDYWNGAYSVSDSNVGKLIFASKEDAIEAIKAYKK